MENLEKLSKAGVYKTPNMFNNAAKPTELIPYFWINKATWTEPYKDFIRQTIYNSERGVKVAIDGIFEGKPYVYDGYFPSVIDFENKYEIIENCLKGILADNEDNKQNNDDK